MIYVMECTGCKKQVEVECKLAEHKIVVKPGFDCACGGLYQQIIVNTGTVFVREGFPKGDPRWEHVSDEPMYIRDKSHLKDVCEQNGNVSRYLEDAV